MINTACREQILRLLAPLAPKRPTRAQRLKTMPPYLGAATDADARPAPEDDAVFPGAQAADPSAAAADLPLPILVSSPGARAALPHLATSNKAASSEAVPLGPQNW